jgi:P27 family predicted phage terminase small subunit
MTNKNQKPPYKPEPPAWLVDDNAKEHFRQAVEDIEAGNIELRASDVNTVALYAQGLADYIRLTAEIRQEGELIDGYRGSKVKNPKLTVLKAAFDRVRDAGNRLGLAPKSRMGAPRRRSETYY